MFELFRWKFMLFWIFDVKTPTMIPRDPQGPKVRGVNDLKSSKNLPLKYEKSLFIASLYYNFKKSGGSADPFDPVLAGPLYDSKLCVLRSRNLLDF